MEYIDTNHNQIAPKVYADLLAQGITETSRNGPVRRLPRVATIIALCPRERVNFCKVRDANPFFHLVEAMAMIAGDNSVKLLSYMAKRMATFSDDGKGYNAFYGTRLRDTWGDQLNAVIAELAAKPDSRQAVAQLWDPADLHRTTKDKACNLCLLFRVSPEGSVEMTSFNRSNDAIWGILTGANTVHLSLFQEYVACALGRGVGAWTHVSNNLHVYTENPQWAAIQDAPSADYYSAPANIALAPLLFEGPQARSAFDRDLLRFVAGCHRAIEEADVSILHSLYFDKATSPFIATVAVPVFFAWHTRKLGVEHDVVVNWVNRIEAQDWHLACRMWLQRRTEKGGAL